MARGASASAPAGGASGTVVEEEAVEASALVEPVSVAVAVLGATVVEPVALPVAVAEAVLAEERQEVFLSSQAALSLGFSRTHM
jgi:hypothetical protein